MVRHFYTNFSVWV